MTPEETDNGEGSDASACPHDYANFIRKGRARFHCPKCDADITLECVFMAEEIIAKRENNHRSHGQAVDSRES
jgi:hypothetical protein